MQFESAKGIDHSKKISYNFDNENWIKWQNEMEYAKNIQVTTNYSFDLLHKTDNQTNNQTSECHFEQMFFYIFFLLRDERRKETVNMKAAFQVHYVNGYRCVLWFAILGYLLFIYKCVCVCMFMRYSMSICYLVKQHMNWKWRSSSVYYVIFNVMQFSCLNRAGIRPSTVLRLGRMRQLLRDLRKNGMIFCAEFVKLIEIVIFYYYSLEEPGNFEAFQ